MTQATKSDIGFVIFLLCCITILHWISFVNQYQIIKKIEKLEKLEKLETRYDAHLLSP
jgi:hypothetical protein